MVDKRVFIKGLGAMAMLVFAAPAAALTRPAEIDHAAGIIRGAIKAAQTDDAGGGPHCLAALRTLCEHFAGNDTENGLLTVSLYDYDLILKVDARLQSMKFTDTARRAAFSRVASDLRRRGN